ncbi:hypothetical protein TCAL_16709 [Tigriopus californicus]|uniref:Dienelactone hydrolase domain-containing protein n=1 Tax=Tigriopus californicus TaxID=6832 RepID=A0A553PK27_TIGCA|nr:carboxymethylenebutenolidase homolog [Tigriopus californicus]TRY78033.1 hypothetical protein TCAL_16709 [Tigriopus californicus]
MSCCPSGAWPELKPDPEYQDAGRVVESNGLNLYIVGKSEKCIIWNYDIFGFNSGRTRQLADQLAHEGQCMVIVPDYYRGTMKDPTEPDLVEFVKKNTQWEQLKVDIEKTVLPYAKGQGAKVFGTIGTCWGTFLVLCLSAYPEIKAGVALHPSHSPISGMVDFPEKSLLEFAKGTPQLFMPAGEDSPNVKPGGLASEILGSDLTIKEFPEMSHGWTTRGDLAKPEVAKDVKLAMSEACAFFAKHVQ